MLVIFTFSMPFMTRLENKLDLIYMYNESYLTLFQMYIVYKTVFTVLAKMCFWLK